MTKGLDLNAIAGILEQDKKQVATRRTAGVRRRKDVTEPREYETWWKLNHAFGDCANPECTDTREHKVVEGNTMVAEVNDKKVCRYCFLDGFNRTEGLDNGAEVV